MRTLSTAALAALNENPIRYFALINLEVTPAVRLTTLPRDVTFSGQTYIADKVTIDLAPPLVSSSVDRETYTITMAGLS